MGPGVFFPTNLDLADMLGRTDFYFYNYYVFYFVGSKHFGFPDFQNSWIAKIPAGRSGGLFDECSLANVDGKYFRGVVWVISLYLIALLGSGGV